MRHDAKLGLALGMLATGFAVAFCCPRQPASTAWLQTGARHPLDRSILDLFPIKAYQTGPVPSAEAANSVQDTAVREAVPPVEPLAAAPLPPPPLSPISAVPPVPTSSTGALRVPTPTVAPQSPNRVLADIPVIPPEPTREPRSGSGNKTTEPAPVQRSTVQRYTVQAGDTLSGIASRFLGSSARFLEIYQLNQDVLSSPDSLQVGMVLTIPETPEANVVNSPARGRGRSTVPGSNRNQTVQQAQQPGEQPLLRR